MNKSLDIPDYYLVPVGDKVEQITPTPVFKRIF